MTGDSLSQRKAQLDKAEREHLEDVVEDLRERVEDNVRFQLTQKDLDDEPEDSESLDEDMEQLVEAIELEGVEGHSWDEAFEKYVTGVGYTIVNRLAALRCMEVRDFINEEVTVFKENGLTPAAETLVHEEFLLEDEAILEAYHNTCDELAEEIEILFDRSSAYSLIDPDDDTFEELCRMLNDVPDEVWRADDVLGWVYEYYNTKLLDDLRQKGDRIGLDPEDVPPANQFYTPHWVVRMLTDNSLGKLYLEHTGELQDVVEAQEEFSPDERKNRPLSPNESPDIADFCTYLVPSEEEGNPTDFEHPRELRIIDPACGSGHFLLYAFDVLERIWRAETDLPHEEIPRRILKHNLYGVDLDMRACQLAAFNLYLKGRTRTEVEEADSFDMPEVGIVCADSSVADIDGVEAVFDEVAGDDQKVEDALRRILDAFEEVHGLGSLLDVRGTLGDLFEDDSDVGGVQITLDDDPRQSHTLGQVLHSLREAVDEHRDSDSFLAQDLRSFVRLLDILAQDYDVALMNPPYGSRNRMPRNVRRYVNEHYKYTSEFYINFFEVCDNLVPDDGRIGMLVPRTFLFKSRFQDFREDFVGDEGSFDFLSEYGLGVLDNATVRTVGTVVRTGRRQQSKGTFIRLHDVDSENKENVFLNTIKEQSSDNIDRFFEISLNDFKRVPRNPICYSTPPSVRSLHENNTKIDAKPAEIDADSVSDALAGLQTSDDDRFARYFWETRDFKKHRPIAKGGAAAWILPKITETVEWDDDGRLLKRSSKSIRTRNEERYGEEGLTWTRVKETGRRFGYFPSSGLFSHTGFLLIPEDPDLIWKMMAVLNSDLYHCLFLSLTVERDWLAGEVGSVPWLEELSGIKELDKLAKRQYELSIQQNTTDPTSPYYIGPGLLPGDRAGFFYDHPHNKKSKEVQKEGPDSAETSVLDAGIENRKDSLRLQMELESIQNEINNKIYDSVGIDNEVVEDIEQEIHLRTSKTPNDRQIPDPEAVSHSQENISTSQSRLVRTSAC